MEDQSLSAWRTIKYFHHLKSEEEDEIATEWPITIMLHGSEYATIVCTPKDLREMIIGFLATEGLIRTMDHIKRLEIDELKGYANIELHHKPDVTGRTERFIGSCCGKSREFYLKQDVQTAKTIMTNMYISTREIHSLMEQFEGDADIHGRTGGVHQAAIASNKNIITSYIDIGRHNALDKLYGYILENRVKLKDTCILFSGRLSSEVVLKVSKIGVGIVIAKSAPTDLALRLADDLNITAIGFARNQSFNAYTHGARIYNDNRTKAYFP